MKYTKVLCCVLTVAIVMFLLKPIATQAAARMETITFKHPVEICITDNVAQWITVEATGQIGITMYARNSSTPLWDSSWSGEYLDFHGNVGYTGFEYNHRYWCGSDVYRIEAYIKSTGGAGLHPAVATYVTYK